MRPFWDEAQCKRVGRKGSTSTPALHTIISEAILNLVATFGSIWVDNLRFHETPMVPEVILA